MTDCPFLHQLPYELRLQIYEYLLPSQCGLKLRQHVPATLDLAILRVCRRVHLEALGVLYDSNTIRVTRNDFCKHAPPSLQTPVDLAQARHLDMVAFNKSIACSFDDGPGECDVCQDCAPGLFHALAAMPRLKSAVIWHPRLEPFIEKLMQTQPRGRTVVLERTLVADSSLFAYHFRAAAFEGKKIVLMDCTRENSLSSRWTL